MNNSKTRAVFLYALVGVFALYSASLWYDYQTLSKRHRNLLEESRNLQQSLDTIRAQYQVLMSGMKNTGEEKENLQTTIDSIRKQNETLAFQIQKVEAQIASVKEEKSYLEEMLINKSKQIEILKSQPASGGEDLVPATEAVQGRIQEKDDELKKLNEQNRILQDKLDRLYHTTNDKIHEINVAKIALSETVSTAQKKIEDEWNTVNLGSVTTSAMPAPPSAEEAAAPETAREAKNEGHVLAINNEHGFVVIDLGKSDNLSNDAMLEVKKNGETIATLSVLELRDAMAACNIKDIRDGQRIEINDPVSILR